MKQIRMNILIKITEAINRNRREYRKLKNPLSDKAIRINNENQGMIKTICIIEKEMDDEFT